MFFYFFPYFFHLFFSYFNSFFFHFSFFFSFNLFIIVSFLFFFHFFLFSIFHSFFLFFFFFLFFKFFFSFFYHFFFIFILNFSFFFSSFFFGVWRKELVFLWTPNLSNQGLTRSFYLNSEPAEPRFGPVLSSNSEPARVQSLDRGTGLSPNLPNQGLAGLFLNSEPVRVLSLEKGTGLSQNSQPAEPGLYPVLFPNYEPAEPGLTWSNSKLRTETLTSGQKHNPVPSYISNQALITFKWFLPINVQINGQKFSGFSEKLSFSPRFLLKNAKICFFEEKWFWLKIYIKFKFSW